MSIRLEYTDQLELDRLGLKYYKVIYPKGQILIQPDLTFKPKSVEKVLEQLGFIVERGSEGCIVGDYLIVKSGPFTQAYDIRDGYMDIDGSDIRQIRLDSYRKDVTGLVVALLGIIQQGGDNSSALQALGRIGCDISNKKLIISNVKSNKSFGLSFQFNVEGSMETVSASRFLYNSQPMA